MQFVVAPVVALGLYAADFHEGRTQLTPDETSQVMQTWAGGGPFQKLWKSPDLDPDWGLLKWDEEHSWAVPEAPGDILRMVREEVGQLNEKPRKGEDLTLSVTVYRYKRMGFLSNPIGWFELVARNRQGRPVWMALDQVKATQSLAVSLADSDTQIMARELRRKLRTAFDR